MLFLDRITPAPVPSEVKELADQNGGLLTTPFADFLLNWKGKVWFRWTKVFTFDKNSVETLVRINTSVPEMLRTRPAP